MEIKHWLKLPFFWLMVAVTFKQLLWTGSLIPWQFPDEQAHFAQVQNIAESVRGFPGMSTSREIYEAEKYLGTLRDERGNNEFTHRPWYNIVYSESELGLYEDQIRQFPQNFRTNLVNTEATGYPHLYYQYVAVFYRLFYQSDFFTRLFAARLGNIPIFLGLVLIAYGVGKILFPKRYFMALTLAILVGFHPMLSFVAAGINSDNLFNLLFTAGIYISLVCLRKGWSWKLVVLMSIVLVLSIYTKPQGRLLPFVYVFPVVYSLLRGQTIKKSLVGGITLLIFGLGTTMIAVYGRRQFIPDISPAVSVWQVFNSNFIEFMRWTLIHTYREVVPWYWGVFRWLSLTYPRVVHRLINWFTLISVFGVAILLIKAFRGKKLPVKRVDIFFMIYVSGIYFLALTVFDYLFKLGHGYQLGIQGRYFFPTIVPHMGLLLIGWSSLIPGKILKQHFIKFLATGMIILHFYAQYFVTASYFDTQNLRRFFTQASQYKPAIFKSPWLEVYVLITTLTIVIFLWYYWQNAPNHKKEKH